MKILIIGSKGFIGSHCINYFRKEGYEVFGCDVVIDYVEKNYFLIDATNSDFKDVFQKNAFDFCINCSGAASVPDSIINPRRDFELNVINVFKILDAIRQFSSGCKFVQISSASVYGNPQTLPVKEDSTLKQLSPYGYHKWQSEVICKEFYELYQVSSAILRIFSAYGTGLKKQIFWDVYQKIKSEKKIVMHGTGSESRDFVFIDDVMHAIECVINNGSFRAEPYNVANGKEITTKEAVEGFLNELNWKGEVIFNGKTRNGDPLNWKADITRLKSLGFSPKIEIEQGLSIYSNWLRNHINV